MYEIEVSRGAKWLDTVSPGWEEKIDINTLNLQCSNVCSLGQTLGAQASKNLNYDYDFAKKHGFFISTPRVKETKGKWFWKKTVERIGNNAEQLLHYRPLTAQWIQQILARRASKRVQAEALAGATQK